MTENSVPSKITVIENTSKESISIGLQQVETKLVSTDTPGELLKGVAPGEKIQYPTSFSGGCAKMVVYTRPDGPVDGYLIWQGIIPLGGENVIRFVRNDLSGDAQVLTADGKIPQCPDVFIGVTGLRGKENFTPAAGIGKEKPTWWWILLFVTLLFGVFLIKNYYI